MVRIQTSCCILFLSYGAVFSVDLKYEFIPAGEFVLVVGEVLWLSQFVADAPHVIQLSASLVRS